MQNNSYASNMIQSEYRKRLSEFEINGSEPDERTQAAIYAQCVELQTLKAPATAVFPEINEMVINGSNGKYSVSGYVDSQNSYGAVLRSNYTYNIEKVGNTWRCTDNFVDTTTQISNNINKTFITNTVALYIIFGILGLLGTVALMAITHAMYGF